MSTQESGLSVSMRQKQRLVLPTHMWDRLPSSGPFENRVYADIMQSDEPVVAAFFGESGIGKGVARTNFGIKTENHEELQSNIKGQQNPLTGEKYLGVKVHTVSTASVYEELDLVRGFKFDGSWGAYSPRDFAIGAPFMTSVIENGISDLPKEDPRYKHLILVEAIGVLKGVDLASSTLRWLARYPYTHAMFILTDDEVQKRALAVREGLEDEDDPEGKTLKATRRSKTDFHKASLETVSRSMGNAKAIRLVRTFMNMELVESQEALLAYGPRPVVFPFTIDDLDKNPDLRRQVLGLRYQQVVEEAGLDHQRTVITDNPVLTDYEARDEKKKVDYYPEWSHNHLLPTHKTTPSPEPYAD